MKKGHEDVQSGGMKQKKKLRTTGLAGAITMRTKKSSELLQLMVARRKIALTRLLSELIQQCDGSLINLGMDQETGSCCRFLSHSPRKETPDGGNQSLRPLLRPSVRRQYNLQSKTPPCTLKMDFVSWFKPISSIVLSVKTVGSFFFPQETNWLVPKVRRY